MTAPDLTAPGGPFPLTRRVVGGREVTVFDRGPATLRELFLSTEAFGDREALVYRDERWTYARQWTEVTRAADALRRRFDVRPGERVVIAARNYPEWVLAFWAVHLLGAVAVPLNAWSTGPELGVLLADCDPVLVLADAERLDRLATLPGLPAGVRGLVGLRAPARDGVVPFEELVEGDGPAPVPDLAVGPDDIATIVYTSGTTGKPKGVVTSHLGHVTTVLSMRLRAAGRGQGTPSTGTTLLAFPLFHIAGMTVMTSNALAGRRVVTMYRWDAAEAVRIAAAEQVQDVTGPPMVVRQMIDEVAGSELDLSGLSSMGSGGALAPAQQYRDIAGLLDGRVSPGTAYGLTETTSAVLAIGGADLLARPTSIGRPLPTVEVRVLDAEGRPAEPGQPGELEVSGPQVALGYHDDPRATSAAFRDGWFRTGDQVVVDDDGYLHLVGRLKDVVIRGGENVSAGEVEAAIGTHPDVVEAAVLGRPHPALGEEVCAVVRLRPGGTLDAEELRAHLSARIAAFKVPVAIRFTTEELPRNASGKLLKQGLRPVVAEEERSWT